MFQTPGGLAAERVAFIKKTIMILNQILQQKRVEVAQRQSILPIRQLEQRPLFNRLPLSAKRSIQAVNSTGIIAEFKRKSPSKGIINNWADITRTTQGYVQAGATCLSVLTDTNFFGGSLVDLQQTRFANPRIPILRKDFIIDPYQVLEAKAFGADFVLLIAACLTPNEIYSLAHLAHQLGLEVLLEVHNEDELERSLNDEIDMVGVNNRNLDNLSLSIDTSLRLADRLSNEYLWVAESGLENSAVIRRLRQTGYSAFLIGEALMKTPVPAKTLANLVSGLPHQSFASKKAWL